jgi:hypothetical protein
MNTFLVLCEEIKSIYNNVTKSKGATWSVDRVEKYKSRTESINLV